MTEHATLAEEILRMSARAGVTTAFGIPGVHNLPFWNAEDVAQPRIVGVRHEQAAVYAADGLSRATGEPGLVLLTSGPGAANAVGAFGEAHSCGSPVLVIASDIANALRSPEGPRGILHEMADQAGMFAAFGAPAVLAGDTPDALQATRRLLDALAGPPSGPAYLGIPTDLLAEPADLAGLPVAAVRDRRPAPEAVPPPGSERRPGPAPVREPVAPSAADATHASDPAPAAGPAPAQAELRALVALLATSPRVVLWAGGGVVRSGTEGLVADLADRLGAPVVTTYAGRGLLAGHPRLVDVPVHEPEVADLVASADLLLGLGSGFDGMGTRNWRMPLPRRTAAVGLGGNLPRTFPWSTLVRAGLAPTLAAVLEALPATPREPWAPQAGRLRDRVLRRLATDPRTVPAVAFLTAVQDSWPAEGAVVCDMAVAGYWVGGYSAQPRPRRLQYPVGWGTLGYALPAAIGPASAGIATLAVCGDGGPMFALGELATWAQESLPATLLVADDGGYGMLRYDQEVFGHPIRGVDLRTPDWGTLAAAFGIAAEEAPDPAAVGPALARAAAANAAGEPRLVLLRARLFPPRITSPRWFELD